MRLFAAPLLLSMLAAAPAVAQDTPFQGPSVTVIGGIDSVESFGRDSTGVVYGGQLGYDWRSNNIVFGIEGEASGSSSKNCFNNAVVATDRLCTKADRDLYAGGRIGVVTGGSTLLYGKAGYTNSRDSFDYKDGATGSTNYSGSGTTDGWRLGAGIEQAVGRNLTLKAEYRYSDYDSATSRQQGVVGVGFRF